MTSNEGRAMTYQEIKMLMIAAELVRHGARTGVVEQLTQLPAAQVRKLIRDITKTRPISGQMPYTTAWFEERTDRLLHCAVFLQVFAAESSTCPDESEAAIFLYAYERYCRAIHRTTGVWRNELLNINRAFQAIQLYKMGELSTRRCVECGCRFMEVHAILARSCQACRHNLMEAAKQGRELLAGSHVDNTVAGTDSLPRG